MRTEIYEATIGTRFLSALINGDESGIDDDNDAMQFMAFELGMYEAAKEDGATGWHWSYEEYYNYAKCEITGLMDKVSDVQLIAFFPMGSTKKENI